MGPTFLLLRPPVVEQLAYLFACLASVILAGHAPLRQRGAAVTLALSVVVGWIVVQSTYTAYAPQYLFWAIGIPVYPTDLWAMTDAATGIIALWLARRFWFGWVLWAISVLQCTYHMQHDYGMSDALYTWWLDKLLAAQIVTFFVIGGPGAWRFIRDRLSTGGRVRRFRHASSAVHTQTIADYAP